MQKKSTSNRDAQLESGGDLSSRAVSSQVLSALKGLTSVFGMGTGGTPSPLPPEIISFLGAEVVVLLSHPLVTCPRYFFLFLKLLAACRLSFSFYLSGCSPFRLRSSRIKFVACYVFTLCYSRPLTHLDNCTLIRLSLLTFSLIRALEIKPSTY